MIHFQCPQCSKGLKATPEQVDQYMRCPYCRAKFIPRDSLDPADESSEVPEIIFGSVDEPPSSPKESLGRPEESVEATDERLASQDPALARRARTEEPLGDKDNGVIASDVKTEPKPRVAVKRAVSNSDTGDGPLSKPAKEINHEELIDMTAMVDIVFFLLIFFLVTSMSVILSSAALPRPEAHSDDGAGKSAKAEEPQNDSNAIVVKINKDDAVEIDGVPFREIADITIRLRQLRESGGAEISVLIIGHGDASHGTAAAILDAGYEVGINHLRLAVLDEEAE